jgi:hypothetical protein
MDIRDDIESGDEDVRLFIGIGNLFTADGVAMDNNARMPAPDNRLIRWLNLDFPSTTVTTEELRVVWVSPNPVTVPRTPTDENFRITDTRAGGTDALAPAKPKDDIITVQFNQAVNVLSGTIGLTLITNPVTPSATGLVAMGTPRGVGFRSTNPNAALPPAYAGCVCWGELQKITDPVARAAASVYHCRVEIDIADPDGFVYGASYAVDVRRFTALGYEDMTDTPELMLYSSASRFFTHFFTIAGRTDLYVYQIWLHTNDGTHITDFENHEGWLIHLETDDEDHPLADSVTDVVELLNRRNGIANAIGLNYMTVVYSRPVVRGVGIVRLDDQRAATLTNPTWSGTSIAPPGPKPSPVPDRYWQTAYDTQQWELSLFGPAFTSGVVNTTRPYGVEYFIDVFGFVCADYWFNAWGTYP